MTFPVGVWTLSANNDTGTLTINSVALATGGGAVWWDRRLRPGRKLSDRRFVGRNDPRVQFLAD